MKVNVDVWISWYDQRIVTPKEHREIVEEAIRDYCEDESLFDEFLSDNYSRIDLLDMDENARQRVREDYHEYCENKYLEDDDDFVEETNEVDLDETEFRHLLRII